MEHHHFNHAVMILSSESHNIFSGLSPENYSKVMQVLKHSILATDFVCLFPLNGQEERPVHGIGRNLPDQLRPRFFSLVESREYSWGLQEHRELLRSMLMTASDIAASSKPWPVQQRVARLVTAEFIVQGDKERNELNIQPQALMDRERQHELPQLQIRWISDICLPLYNVDLETPLCLPLHFLALDGRSWPLNCDYQHHGGQNLSLKYNQGFPKYFPKFSKADLVESIGQMNPKLNAMAEGALSNMKSWAQMTSDPINQKGVSISDHETI
uniref:(California timema) hypothetical protein n=1 Tax=Timema californicum TaxID=61474 RepID=A0A7R9JFK8_TIMCA|nr:unnamed protein product [Timema californicum]